MRSDHDNTGCLQFGKAHRGSDINDEQVCPMLYMDYFFDLSAVSDEDLSEAIVATQRTLAAMQREQAHRDYQRTEKLLQLDR